MLSEIDIKDWERTAVELKLYESSRCSVVSLKEEPDVPFWFSHVDGMYSYCQLSDGSLFHPTAWSEVYLWSKKP